MKNKTVILILSVLAVAMYTTAVINFCTGNVLGGIGDVLMASSDALMAYALYRMGQLGRLADATRKAVIALLEQLTKGVPATLTVKDGKGTTTLGHDDDGDADPANAPEEELTDEEKRIRRMAEIERKVGATCLKDEHGRIWLDELDPDRGDDVAPIIPDCSLFCAIEFQNIEDPQTAKVMSGEIGINETK